MHGACSATTMTPATFIFVSHVKPPNTDANRDPRDLNVTGIFVNADYYVLGGDLAVAVRRCSQHTLRLPRIFGKYNNKSSTQYKHIRFDVFKSTGRLRIYLSIIRVARPRTAIGRNVDYPRAFRRQGKTSGYIIV